MPEWQLLPVRDSEAWAEQRRAELDISRSRAMELGREALEALTAGGYRMDQGAWVDWSDQVRAAKAARVSISPDMRLPATANPGSLKTRVTIGNLTTLGAARELVDRGRRPLALNFANPVVPGGGWLGGARAQEEYLCRSSALFATIADDAMYVAHRRRTDYESSAWAILSPDVPAFRADDGVPLDEPWLCSMITMAAPVASRVGQPRSAELMAERTRRLLEIAVAHGYTDLVLGAWGCGAFGNDADRTADTFVEAITGPYAGRFTEVVFAITDWSPERRFLEPFARSWRAASDRAGRSALAVLDLDDGDVNADWIKRVGPNRRVADRDE